MRGAVGEDGPGGLGGLRALRSVPRVEGGGSAAPPSRSEHSELSAAVGPRGGPRGPRVWLCVLGLNAGCPIKAMLAFREWGGL